MSGVTPIRKRVERLALRATRSDPLTLSRALKLGEEAVVRAVLDELVLQRKIMYCMSIKFGERVNYYWNPENPDTGKKHPWRKRTIPEGAA